MDQEKHAAEGERCAHRTALCLYPVRARPQRQRSAERSAEVGESYLTASTAGGPHETETDEDGLAM